MRISAALPTGVAALLFESAARRRALEAALVPLLERRGYGEAILPVLDYAAPYEPLLDERGRGELYRFVGRDGELLALRGDFTPMLARLLAPRAAALARPLRLFYRGDVVRYGAARAGHLREFYQLGAELLGAGGEVAEREIVELFCELLAGAPGTRARVVLGFVGALDEALAACAEPAAMARAVARRERDLARQGGAALLEVVEHGVPRRARDLGAAADRLERLQALAGELGERFPSLRLHVDLAEFADLSTAAAQAATGPRPYYDGVVFRAFAPDAALPLGGGGRYDRLFRALGADMPAVGFSLSVDRLVLEGER